MTLRVILSTNNNADYFQFWPTVSRTWQRLVGAEPTLALIANEDFSLPPGTGSVVRFAPLTGVPTSLQAQAIRLLLPAVFPDDVCLISDMDMLPCASRYFLLPLESDTDALVVYRDRATRPEERRISMCYNAAKGRTFGRIFKVETGADIEARLREWAALRWGWSTDERVLFEAVEAWTARGGNVIRLGHTVTQRADRSVNARQIARLLRGSLIDAHLPRPYSLNPRRIDLMAQLTVLRSRIAGEPPQAVDVRVPT